MKPLRWPRSGMWAVTAWIHSSGSKMWTVAPVRGSGAVAFRRGCTLFERAHNLPLGRSPRHTRGWRRRMARDALAG
jgi:hypothetical protein